MDNGVCGHDITHVFKVNGLVALPFNGNKLMEGWQISGIQSANSGLPPTIYDGYPRLVCRL